MQSEKHKLDIYLDEYVQWELWIEDRSLWPDRDNNIFINHDWVCGSEQHDPERIINLGSVNP